MHSHTHSHTSNFGLNWSPANTALAILLTLLFLIFLFLFMTLTAPPAFAQAQNSVPATAREAASMPQFAARLAPQAQRHAMASQAPHPVPPRTSSINPRNPRARGQRGWLPDDTLYDNGPINGNTDAWTINFGFAVSDTFTTNGSQITGLQFGAWLFPGDVLLSAEVLIGTAEYGNDLFDQVVSFTQSSNCPINTFGYAICTETATFTANIGAGTPWITLQNAVVNTGDPLYWDENSGPSLASANSVGTIPSEAFSVEGGCGDQCLPPPLPCFEPGGGLQVIHDFTAQEGGAGGVTVDNAGNVYGTTSLGGDYGLGLAYKLASKDQGWIFTPLYSFTGGYNGSYPNITTIVGPEGALYGAAAGGLQNCDAGQYCGLVYRLRPPANACPAVSCSWTEEVLYRFTGGIDANGPVAALAFDRNGNLYGTASSGGAYGYGAVFELTPSNGGWTESVIYSFPGATYGVSPGGLLVGTDGKLYGTAGGGDEWSCTYGCGLVFQLTPSEAGWTENVLYIFHNTQADGAYPRDLVQDSSGNLYGISSGEVDYNGDYRNAGIEFMLSPSNGNNWTFTELLLEQHGQHYDDFFSSFAMDTAGNTYIAGSAVVIDLSCGSDWGNCYFWAGGHGLGATYVNQQFNAYGLAPDAQGNHLYGITPDCGANGRGTVWQLSP